MFKFLLFILFNIIVVLNLWTIGLLFSNSGNIIFYGLLFNIFGNFFLSILIGSPDIIFLIMNNLCFWFLLHLFIILKRNINFIINFGPQHLAIHGILFLIVEFKVNLGMGLLHRGTEKLIEYKMCFKKVPSFDLLLIAQEKKQCLI